MTRSADIDALSKAVCPECGHLVLRYHTFYDCDYHNSCECSLNNAASLVASGVCVTPPEVDAS